MNLKKIKDSVKNWFVDYLDEDGDVQTYGPDTKDGCETWIKFQESIESSGDGVEILGDPYEETISYEAAAEEVITKELIYDLYREGKITVKIPEDVDVDSFVEACLDRVNMLWGEPDVNFSYDQRSFETKVSKGKLTIYSNS